jgi:hypothetical protein
MTPRAWVGSNVRFLGMVGMALCGVGTLAALFIILVRVPALAGSKLEELYGTLLGVGVGMTFAVAALLINLTIMVYTTTGGASSGRPRD